VPITATASEAMRGASREPRPRDSHISAGRKTATKISYPVSTPTLKPTSPRTSVAPSKPSLPSTEANLKPCTRPKPKLQIVNKRPTLTPLLPSESMPWRANRRQDPAPIHMQVNVFETAVTDDVIIRNNLASYLHDHHPKTAHLAKPIQLA